MPMTSALAGALAALAAGGVAYVFLYPMLSGEARAEKRKTALVGGGQKRAERGASNAANRREQIAQTLKDVEARQKAQKRVSLEMRLAQAGLAWGKARFYVLSLILALPLALIGLAVDGPLAAFGLGFAGFFGLPRWALAFLKRRRVKKFVDELPNALDIVVRGIRAGLPLNDCLRMIAAEAREPLRSEFRTVIEAQTLGIPVGEACAKIYERVPVPEANFFGIVISIQQKAGGNLSEAIGNLSRVLRDRKRMLGKVQAMSMEAKASAAIIAALPFVVAFLTYLSSPDYIELLWTKQMGKLILVAAGLWMALGVFVMKKMINFDV